MSDFDSLTWALEDWFEKLLREMPDAVRQRVERELFPMPWDDLSADQRRGVALQLDYQHDPATEQDRQFWWDFASRQRDLEEQVVQWEAVLTPTAGDLAQKETRIAELRQELARMELQRRQARGAYYPERNRPKGGEAEFSIARTLPKIYVAYPKAMKLLAERLDATPEEIAAWVWMGPKEGGLEAYLNANELDPPPRFYYDIGRGDDFDYLSPLMACWFRENDIASFQPANRYITGKALLDRWSKHSGIQPEAFIQAKIAESRLHDLHPICGLTQGTNSRNSSFPPVTSGLFALSDVKDIEAEDFGEGDERNEPPAKAKREIKADTSNWKMLVQAEAARHWAALRKDGANPTKFSIKDDLARWCRENGVKTKTGINPNPEYIYRHALRDWVPPTG